MQIVVLSDIHDHVWHLEVVLDSEPVKACEALICCGDLCSPFVIAMMGRLFEGEIHVVFGNNDADTFRITSIARSHFADRMLLHGEYARLELGGVNIAVNHFDHIALDLAHSARFDWVLYGHNHLARHELLEIHSRPVHLLNPGTLMGMSLGRGGPMIVPHSFCVIDTDSGGSVQGYEVKLEQKVVLPWELPSS